MTFTHLFDTSAGGFKVSIYVTSIEDGKFDAKVLAQKGGEVVGLDFLFGVKDEQKSLKKSIVDKMDQEQFISGLVEFAQGRLDGVTTKGPVLAAPTPTPEEVVEDEVVVDDGQMSFLTE